MQYVHATRETGARRTRISFELGFLDILGVLGELNSCCTSDACNIVAACWASAALDADIVAQSLAI